MGFRDIRKQVIDALNSGAVQHEARGDINDKNLLATGAMTIADVIRLLSRCRGNQHESSPHHQDASIEVHVFKPLDDGTQWYIKLYCIDPDVWFISVHNS